MYPLLFGPTIEAQYGIVSTQLQSESSQSTQHLSENGPMKATRGRDN